jgi:hypothetical protein
VYGAEFIALKRRARNRRQRSSSTATASATAAAESQTVVANATTVFEPEKGTELAQSVEPAQSAERIQCAEHFVVEPDGVACATTRATQASTSPTGVADATRSNSSSSSISQSAVRDKVLAALCGLGFRRNEACAALRDLDEPETDSSAVLRAALQRLTPPAIHSRTPA